MSVDVTSGLQGMQAWALPDLCGWHRGVKPGDVMGRRAPCWCSRHGLNKETLWAPSFQCLLSNQQLQAVFLMPCRLYVRVFIARFCQVTVVECFKTGEVEFGWDLFIVKKTCYQTTKHVRWDLVQKKQESGWERENRWKDWILEEVEKEECEGNLFCVCLERIGASYTPHSVNLARAVASSRLHSSVLSWAGLPMGGAPVAAASHTGQRVRLTDGVKGAQMERCLVVPGSRHVLDLWNPQVGQSNNPERKYLSLSLSPMDKRGEGHCQQFHN